MEEILREKLKTYETNGNIVAIKDITSIVMEQYVEPDKLEMIELAQNIVYEYFSLVVNIELLNEDSLNNYIDQVYYLCLEYFTLDYDKMFNEIYNFTDGDMDEYQTLGFEYHVKLLYDDINTIINPNYDYDIFKDNHSYAKKNILEYSIRNFYYKLFVKRGLIEPIKSETSNIYNYYKVETGMGQELAWLCGTIDGLIYDHVKRYR